MKKHIIDDVDLIFESYVNSLAEDAEDFKNFDFEKLFQDLDNLNAISDNKILVDKASERKETLQKIFHARSFEEARKIFEDYIKNDSKMKEDKKNRLLSYIKNVIAKKFGTRLSEIQKCAKNNIFWKDEEND